MNVNNKPLIIVDEADNLATFEGNPAETGVSIMKETDLATLKTLIGKI